MGFSISGAKKGLDSSTVSDRKAGTSEEEARSLGKSEEALTNAQLQEKAMAGGFNTGRDVVLSTRLTKEEKEEEEPELTHEQRQMQGMGEAALPLNTAGSRGRAAAQAETNKKAFETRQMVANQAALGKKLNEIDAETQAEIEAKKQQYFSLEAKTARELEYDMSSPALDGLTEEQKREAMLAGGGMTHQDFMKSKDEEFSAELREIEKEAELRKNLAADPQYLERRAKARLDESMLLAQRNLQYLLKSRETAEKAETPGAEFGSWGLSQLSEDIIFGTGREAATQFDIDLERRVEKRKTRKGKQSPWTSIRRAVTFPVTWPIELAMAEANKDLDPEERYDDPLEYLREEFAETEKSGKVAAAGTLGAVTVVPRIGVAGSRDIIFQMTRGKRGMAFGESIDQAIAMDGYGGDLDEDGEAVPLSEEAKMMVDAFKLDPVGMAGDLLAESIQDPLGMFMTIYGFTNPLAAEASLAKANRTVRRLNALARQAKYSRVKFNALVQGARTSGVETLEFKRQLERLRRLDRLMTRQQRLTQFEIKLHNSMVGRAGTAAVKQGVEGGFQGITANFIMSSDKDMWNTFAVEGMEEALFGIATTIATPNAYYERKNVKNALERLQLGTASKTDAQIMEDVLNHHLFNRAQSVENQLQEIMFATGEQFDPNAAEAADPMQIKEGNITSISSKDRKNLEKGIEKAKKSAETLKAEQSSIDAKIQDGMAKDEDPGYLSELAAKSEELTQQIDRLEEEVANSTQRLQESANESAQPAIASRSGVVVFAEKQMDRAYENLGTENDAYGGNSHTQNPESNAYADYRAMVWQGANVNGKTLKALFEDLDTEAGAAGAGRDAMRRLILSEQHELAVIQGKKGFLTREGRGKVAFADRSDLKTDGDRTLESVLQNKLALGLASVKGGVGVKINHDIGIEGVGVTLSLDKRLFKDSFRVAKQAMVVKKLETELSTLRSSTQETTSAQAERMKARVAAERAKFGVMAEAYGAMKVASNRARMNERMQASVDKTKDAGRKVDPKQKLEAQRKVENILDELQELDKRYISTQEGNFDPSLDAEYRNAETRLKQAQKDLEEIGSGVNEEQFLHNRARSVGMKLEFREGIEMKDGSTATALNVAHRGEAHTDSQGREYVPGTIYVDPKQVRKDFEVDRIFRDDNARDSDTGKKVAGKYPYYRSPARKKIKTYEDALQFVVEHEIAHTDRPPTKLLREGKQGLSPTDRPAGNPETESLANVMAERAMEQQGPKQAEFGAAAQTALDDLGNLSAEMKRVAQEQLLEEDLPGGVEPDAEAQMDAEAMGEADGQAQGQEAAGEAQAAETTTFQQRRLENLSDMLHQTLNEGGSYFSIGNNLVETSPVTHNGMRGVEFRIMNSVNDVNTFVVTADGQVTMTERGETLDFQQMVEENDLIKFIDSANPEVGVEPDIESIASFMNTRELDLETVMERFGIKTEGQLATEIHELTNQIRRDWVKFRDPLQTKAALTELNSKIVEAAANESATYADAKQRFTKEQASIENQVEALRTAFQNGELSVEELSQALATMSKNYGYNIDVNFRAFSIYDSSKSIDNHMVMSEPFRAWIATAISQGDVSVATMPRAFFHLPGILGLKGYMNEGNFPSFKMMAMNAVEEGGFFNFPMITDAGGGNAVWTYGTYNESATGRTMVRVRHQIPATASNPAGYIQWLVDANEMMKWMENPDYRIPIGEKTMYPEVNGTHLSPTIIPSFSAAQKADMKNNSVLTHREHWQVRQNLENGIQFGQGQSIVMDSRSMEKGDQYKIWTPYGMQRVEVGVKSIGGRDFRVLKGLDRPQRYPLTILIEHLDGVHVLNNSDIDPQKALERHPTDNPENRMPDPEQVHNDFKLQDAEFYNKHGRMKVREEMKPNEIQMREEAARAILKMLDAQAEGGPVGVSEGEVRAEAGTLDANERVELMDEGNEKYDARAKVRHQARKQMDALNNELKKANNSAQANDGKTEVATSTAVADANASTMEAPQNRNDTVPRYEKPKLYKKQKAPAAKPEDAARILQDKNATDADLDALANMSHEMSLTDDTGTLLSKIVSRYFGEFGSEIRTTDMNAASGDFFSFLPSDLRFDMENLNSRNDTTTQVLKKLHGRTSVVNTIPTEHWAPVGSKDLIFLNGSSRSRNEDLRYQTPDLQHVQTQANYDLLRGLQVLDTNGLMIAIMPDDFGLRRGGSPENKSVLQQAFKQAELVLAQRLDDGRVTGGGTLVVFQKVENPDMDASQNRFGTMNNRKLKAKTILRRIDNGEFSAMDVRSSGRVAPDLGLAERLPTESLFGESDFSSREQGSETYELSREGAERIVGNMNGLEQGIPANDMDFSTNESAIPAAAELASRLFSNQKNSIVQIVMDNAEHSAPVTTGFDWPELWGFSVSNDGSSSWDSRVELKNQDGIAIEDLGLTPEDVIGHVINKRAKFPKSSELDTGNGAWGPRFQPVVFTDADGRIEAVKIQEHVSLDSDYEMLKAAIEARTGYGNVEILTKDSGGDDLNRAAALRRVATGDSKIIITDSASQLDIPNYRGGSKVVIDKPEETGAINLNKQFSEEMSEKLREHGIWEVAMHNQEVALKQNIKQINEMIFEYNLLTEGFIENVRNAVTDSGGIADFRKMFLNPELDTSIADLESQINGMRDKHARMSQRLKDMDPATDIAKKTKTNADNVLRKIVGAQQQLRLMQNVNNLSTDFRSLWEQYSKIANIESETQSMRRADQIGRDLMSFSKALVGDPATRYPNLYTAISEKEARFSHWKDTLPPHKFTMNSGGATGADSIFDKVARSYKMRVKNWSFQGHNTKAKDTIKLGPKQLAMADQALQKAAFAMHRKWPHPTNEYINNLTRRNFFQIRNAETVVAFSHFDTYKKPNGEIVRTDYVKGGTGWSVEMARQMGKKTYVYDLGEKKWYESTFGGGFRETANVKIEKNFAGIGAHKLTPEESLDVENRVTEIFQNQFGVVSPYRSARTSINGYEVSSAGDSRFSAMNATLKDGRTIEQHWQEDVKGWQSDEGQLFPEPVEAFSDFLDKGGNASHKGIWYDDFVYNKKNSTPKDGIYVGRGSKWGNPFPINENMTREQSVRKYIEHLSQNPELVEAAKKELVGKKLVCFCSPQMCHAHVLSILANGGRSRSNTINGKDKPPNFKHTLQSDFFLGKNVTPGMKTKNTFEAIQAGEKTSITEFEKEKAAQMASLRIGDIVKIQGRDRVQFVRITEDPTIFEPQNFDDNTWHAYAASEGWSVEFAKDRFGDKKAGLRVRFEPLDLELEYTNLWRQWAEENPDLMEELATKSKNKTLTDKFATTDNNQARALATILNERHNNGEQQVAARAKAHYAIKQTKENARFLNEKIEFIYENLKGVVPGMDALIPKSAITNIMNHFVEEELKLQAASLEAGSIYSESFVNVVNDAAESFGDMVENFIHESIMTPDDVLMVLKDKEAASREVVQSATDPEYAGGETDMTGVLQRDLERQRSRMRHEAGSSRTHLSEVDARAMAVEERAAFQETMNRYYNTKKELTELRARVDYLSQRSRLGKAELSEQEKAKSRILKLEEDLHNISENASSLGMRPSQMLRSYKGRRYREFMDNYRATKRKLRDQKNARHTRDAAADRALYYGKTDDFMDVAEEAGSEMTGLGGQAGIVGADRAPTLGERFRGKTMMAALGITGLHLISPMAANAATGPDDDQGADWTPFGLGLIGVSYLLGPRRAMGMLKRMSKTGAAAFKQVALSNPATWIEAHQQMAIRTGKKVPVVGSALGKMWHSKALEFASTRTQNLTAKYGIDYNLDAAAERVFYLKLGAQSRMVQPLKNGYDKLTTLEQQQFMIALNEIFEKGDLEGEYSNTVAGLAYSFKDTFSTINDFVESKGLTDRFGRKYPKITLTPRTLNKDAILKMLENQIGATANKAYDATVSEVKSIRDDAILGNKSTDPQDIANFMMSSYLNAGGKNAYPVMRRIASAVQDVFPDADRKSLISNMKGQSDNNAQAEARKLNAQAGYKNRVIGLNETYNFGKKMYVDDVGTVFRTLTGTLDDLINYSEFGPNLRRLHDFFDQIEIREPGATAPSMLGGPGLREVYIREITGNALNYEAMDNVDRHKLDPYFLEQGLTRRAAEATVDGFNYYQYLTKIMLSLNATIKGSLGGQGSTLAYLGGKNFLKGARDAMMDMRPDEVEAIRTLIQGGFTDVSREVNIGSEGRFTRMMETPARDWDTIKAMRDAAPDWVKEGTKGLDRTVGAFERNPLWQLYRAAEYMNRAVAFNGGKHWMLDQLANVNHQGQMWRKSRADLEQIFNARELEAMLQNGPTPSQMTRAGLYIANKTQGTGRVSELQTWGYSPVGKGIRLFRSTLMRTGKLWNDNYFAPAFSPEWADKYNDGKQTYKPLMQAIAAITPVGVASTSILSFLGQNEFLEDELVEKSNVWKLVGLIVASNAAGIQYDLLEQWATDKGNTQRDWFLTFLTGSHGRLVQNVGEVARTIASEGPTQGILQGIKREVAGVSQFGKMWEHGIAVGGLEVPFKYGGEFRMKNLFSTAMFPWLTDPKKVAMIDKRIRMEAALSVENDIRGLLQQIKEAEAYGEDGQAVIEVFMELLGQAEDLKKNLEDAQNAYVNKTRENIVQEQRNELYSLGNLSELQAD